MTALPIRHGFAGAALAVCLGFRARRAARQPDFGDDTSQWANDGECDDPRFEGEGSARHVARRRSRTTTRPIAARCSAAGRICAARSERRRRAAHAARPARERRRHLDVRRVLRRLHVHGHRGPARRRRPALRRLRSVRLRARAERRAVRQRRLRRRCEPLAAVARPDRERRIPRHGHELRQGRDRRLHAVDRRRRQRRPHRPHGAQRPARVGRRDADERRVRRQLRVRGLAGAARRDRLALVGVRHLSDPQGPRRRANRERRRRRRQRRRPQQHRGRPDRGRHVPGARDELRDRRERRLRA